MTLGLTTLTSVFLIIKKIKLEDKFYLYSSLKKRKLVFLNM